MSIQITFRPIDRWTTGFTAERKNSPFGASYADTLDLLERELWHLGAREVVLMLALQESDIRRDGMPRAQARPAHPGVILAFDSIHGPLKYATDTFRDWQSNLRAIALGLESLRRVDRYGITKRGEQYTGWKQLPACTEPVMSTQQAARILADGGGTDAGVVLVDAQVAKTAYRLAAQRVHPDAGGSTEAFQRLNEAKRIIDAHHGAAA